MSTWLGASVADHGRVTPRLAALQSDGRASEAQRLGKYARPNYYRQSSPATDDDAFFSERPVRTPEDGRG